jgi:4-amino-4-deoxy-L-arabinose transferase-like glycosyltransferase
VSPRRFRTALAAVALAGFAIRVAYALIADVPRGFGDDVWYNAVARGLVHGRGFSDPFRSLSESGAVVFGNGGDPIVTAFHPPLFPALLAIPSALGLDSYTAHQIVGCALGAATVVAIGLVARRLLDERAGIAAAAVAAVFLPLVTREALLQSESLYGLLIALSLLAALRLRERPAARRGAALGLAIGLAALTRSEALLLVPALAAPIAWRAERGRRLVPFALACVAVAVVCLPWCVRNTLEFDRPTGITTGDGSVVAGANLHSTYYGRLLGDWDFQGLYRTPAGRHPSLNEAVQSDRWRSEGVTYAREHAARLPVVLGARVLRTWDLYPFSPVERADYGSSYYKHVHSLEYPAQLELLALVALAIAGGVGLRRRGRPLWPFLVPVALVTLVSVLGHGDPRYRHAADVSLAVLAGAGLSFAWEARRRASRTPPAPDPRPDPC